METDIRSVLANLNDFKVLAEFDEDQQAYVAHCIDTGATATGATLDAAASLMTQVLENDFAIAIRTDSLSSLLHTYASQDIRERWYEAKAYAPDSVRMIEVRIPDDPRKRGVQSEFRVSKRESVA